MLEISAAVYEFQQVKKITYSHCYLSFYFPLLCLLTGYSCNQLDAELAELEISGLDILYVIRYSG